MPLPTLVFLAFASGLAAALAGRNELRVTPRPALLTRSFGAYVVFAGMLLIPISVYFYVFHGDWFLLYSVDVRRIPSAVAMVGFLLEGGVGAIGFALGGVMVRSQRETIGGAVAGLGILGAAIVPVVARERLADVGSFAQYKGGFGLESFDQGPVFQGSVLMGALLLVGLMYLLGRLHMSGRRG